MSANTQRHNVHSSNHNITPSDQPHNQLEWRQKDQQQCQYQWPEVQNERVNATQMHANESNNERTNTSMTNPANMNPGANAIEYNSEQVNTSANDESNKEHEPWHRHQCHQVQRQTGQYQHNANGTMNMSPTHSTHAIKYNSEWANTSMKTNNKWRTSQHQHNANTKWFLQHFPLTNHLHQAPLYLMVVIPVPNPAFCIANN